MAIRSEFSVGKKPLMRSVSKASVCVALVMLGACATTANDKSTIRNAIGVSTNAQNDGSGLDPVAAAAFWGTRYDRDPKDAEVAVEFASSLRKIGSRTEALKVISKTAEHNPDNPNVMFEFGKTLIEDSRAFEAVRHIEYAQKNLPDSWQILSAYGVALDQIGEHDAALEKYNRALAIEPNAVSVMNNKGLSYALAGKLDLAQNILMQASGRHRANSKVRQNLALVSALKGDIAQAERLARSDLPPQVANNNIAYFRSLLSQPAYWQDFAANEIDTPSFDEPLFEAAPSVPEAMVEEIAEPEVFEQVDPLFVDPLPEESFESEEYFEEELEEELENVGAPLVLGPATLPSNASYEEGTEEEAEKVLSLDEIINQDASFKDDADEVDIDEVELSVVEVEDAGVDDSVFELENVEVETNDGNDG